jgi:single-stranded-DNA-specific exonuclease
LAVVQTLSRTGKRWIYTPVDHAKVATVSNELGVSRLLAEILVKRGYDTPEVANKFLNPSLDDLGDPRRLPDFDSAVKEILGAHERKEKIFVHGDYDVDGVTSSAILDRFLKKIGCDVHTHVPHRIKEGYGINLDAVEEAHRQGAKLFLTCDCGISAHEQVEKAKALGMKVVVTDHHELKDTLPGAQAVVNPHRGDSDYPFSDLSGAGVVFRLCEGLAAILDPLSVPSYRKNYLDLACLGTIADVMPLVNDNRIIAKFGLESLTQTKKKGLVALKEVSEITHRVASYDVGFKLGPRLNAAGRVDDAALSLRLLLAETVEEANELARELDRHNTDRRALQEKMIQEAIAQAVALDLTNNYALLIFDASWHPGVVGIVAGKLKEHFYRPAFVGTVDPETGKGKASGRSIPGFNLAEMINAHPKLVAGGGHAMAAGMSFQSKDVEEIRAAFDAYAKQQLTAEDMIPGLEISAFAKPDEVHMELIRELSKLEPFGMANPKPILGAEGIEIKSVRQIGADGRHARFILGDGTTAVAFGLYEYAQNCQPDERLDFVFEPNLNEYRGETSLQWKVQDLR